MKTKEPKLTKKQWKYIGIGMATGIVCGVIILAPFMVLMDIVEDYLFGWNRVFFILATAIPYMILIKGGLGYHVFLRVLNFYLKAGEE